MRGSNVRTSQLYNDSTVSMANVDCVLNIYYVYINLYIYIQNTDRLPYTE